MNSLKLKQKENTKLYSVFSSWRGDPRAENSRKIG